MGGVCERPGCNRVAAAAVALDPRARIVWIGDLEGSGASVNRMCATCADNLTAPRGWERRDVREAPRLFALPTGPDDDKPRPRKRRSRRAPADGSVAADLPVAVGQHEPAPPPAVAPLDDTPPLSLGELHQADAPISDAAAALLAAGAETPLLARAFRSARAG
jgi:hypothetical protein